MNLKKSRIFGLVMFKRRVTDQYVGPTGQRHPGAGAGKGFLFLFRMIEQDQELVKIIKSLLYSFKNFDQ